MPRGIFPPLSIVRHGTNRRPPVKVIAPVKQCGNDVAQSVFSVMEHFTLHQNRGADFPFNIAQALMRLPAAGKRMDIRKLAVDPFA